jgi:hypothetical protein
MGSMNTLSGITATCLYWRGESCLPYTRIPIAYHQHQHHNQKKLPLQTLVGIACLFPWHGTQKQAARRLWRIVSRKGGGESADTAREVRKYVLRLSQELIYQDVCHQPFKSGFIHFLAALGINPDTLRLRTAPEYSSLLGSLVYCVRVLAAKVSSRKRFTVTTVLYRNLAIAKFSIRT